MLDAIVGWAFLGAGIVVAIGIILGLAMKR